ncbi:MAG: relaxase/mobilization nuclease domain-containing protein [Bacteroides sp.]
MMAKIVQGGCFRGVVNYVLDKKEATQLATKGLRTADKNSLISSFITQSKLNPISKSVAHISPDFSAQDREKLTNSKMIEIAQEYMAKMGYGNTQVLIVRHSDREHPHLHLILNRIDFNGKRISDQNEKIHNVKVCRELTLKHGLYVSSGKENVKRERLREPDATKYRIYDALVKNVPLSKSWAELQSRLRAEGIAVGFKTKGSTAQIEGVRFTSNNLTFNGSKVDRQFNYSKIDYALRQNAREEQQNLPLMQQPQHRPKHHESNTISDFIGSLFDIPIFSNGTDHEEEAFRKRMQRKKKKKGLSL